MAREPRYVPPLYGTPRTPGRETLGPRVAAVAKALGKPLLPWQEYVVNVAMEIDPDDGMLAYDEVVIVVMRQNGKSELVLPIMTHRCLGFQQAGPQRVLYTAQTADKARDKWRDVHLKRLTDSEFANLFTYRVKINSEAMFWRETGSIWSPSGTTAKTAGTGDTLDMAVIDEAWSRPDNRTELGLRPTMLTRPWKQLWILSMVPGLSRAQPHEWPYLKAKMRAGRARVETGQRRGMAYFEFAAEPGLDPADPNTWWSCMPALGRTIPEKAVRGDFDAMDLIDFCAEYLGWTPEVGGARWRVISKATWRALRDDTSQASDALTIAVDSTEDRAMTTISSASLRADGDIHLEVIERLPGVEWAEDALLTLSEAQMPGAVVIDPNGPASSLILPLENAGMKILKPSLKEVAAACGRFYDATGEQRVGDTSVPEPRRYVRHTGQSELDNSVAGAMKYTFGDQWRWERDAGDSSPLVSATLAMWGGEQTDWIGGAYDVMESLG